MLVYRLTELEMELEALRFLAEELLMARNIELLRQFHSDLVTFRFDETRPSLSLNVPNWAPLDTIPAWLYDRHGATRVVAATVRFRVHLERVAGDPQHAGLTNMEAVIEIRELVSKTLLKHLRFGFNAEGSQGAYFHVVPHDIDVLSPMLPTALTSPFAVLELVLCEMFPERWIGLVRAGSAGYDWRNIQKRRVDVLTNWLQSLSNGVTSPWIATRTARPGPRLFA